MVVSMVLELLGLLLVVLLLVLLELLRLLLKAAAGGSVAAAPARLAIVPFCVWPCRRHRRGTIVDFVLEPPL